MSNTGVRRKVDDLGRVVIPAGIRRSMDIREGESLEFHVEGDRIVLTRATDRCILCGHQGADLREVHDRRICPGCVRAIRGLPGAAIHDEPRASDRPRGDGQAGAADPPTPDAPAADARDRRRPRDDELDLDARRLMAVARGRRARREAADDPGRRDAEEAHREDAGRDVYGPASTTAW